MLKLFTKIIAAVVSLITAALPAVFGSYNKNRQPCSDILPETWAAVDGLGRTLPMKGEVKEKDETKFVGVFYWIWHTTFAETHEAKNATEILAEHPDILHDFD